MGWFKINHKIFKCSVAILTVFLIYIVLFILGSEDYVFGMVGGWVGLISALVIIGDSYFHPISASSFKLLYWRAICDIGVASRFILTPAFNLYICNSTTCTRETADEGKCTLPSLYFQFFIIASECWFLFNGVDLYYSITNPFSSFHSREKYYHFYTWVIASAFTFLPLILNTDYRIFGFFYISDRIDDSAFCWLHIESQERLGYPMWFLFFVPLLTFYIICVISLLVAYRRLRRGLTKSFLPRLTFLVNNTVNVLILILFWCIFLVTYVWAFFNENNSTYNGNVVAVLFFLLGSKGFASLIIWMIASDHQSFYTNMVFQTVRVSILGYGNAGGSTTIGGGAGGTRGSTVDRGSMVTTVNGTTRESELRHTHGDGSITNVSNRNTMNTITPKGAELDEKDEDWLSQQDETVDANNALREELLAFATAGIRSTARAGNTLTSDHTMLIRTPKQSKTTQGNAANNVASGGDGITHIITPWFFLKFIFGEAEEILAIQAMVATKVRSVEENFHRQTIVRDSVSSVTSMMGRRSSLRGSRHSGRQSNNSQSNANGPDSGPPSMQTTSTMTMNPSAPSISTKGTIPPAPPLSTGSTNAPLSPNTTSQRKHPGRSSTGASNNVLARLSQADDVARMSDMFDPTTIQGYDGRNNQILSKNVPASPSPSSSHRTYSNTSSMQKFILGHRVPSTGVESDIPGDQQYFAEDLEEPHDEEEPQQETVNASSKLTTESERGLSIRYWWNRILKSLHLDDSDAVEFIEYMPYHFRRVRLAYGVTDEIYISAFSTTLKERLTEGGASGAFFFFSKGEKFIAKSCSLEDMIVLVNTAESYSDYMVSNLDTYISKIFGVYKLRIYGNSLYFFVMNNLFYNPERLTMNEKYDLKGSWVSRNANPPREGQSLTCSYCEQKFLFIRKKSKKAANNTGATSTATATSNIRASMAPGAADTGTLSMAETFSPLMNQANSFAHNNPNTTTDTNTTTPNENPSGDIADINDDGHKGHQRKCPYTVTGEHSPNVILKDNDIKYKIRLSTDTTRQILRQIKSDADYLCSVGIMDYSLLLGVHNTEYEVYEDMNTGEMTLLRVGANLMMDEIPVDVNDGIDPMDTTTATTPTGTTETAGTAPTATAEGSLDAHMIPTPLATASMNPPLLPSSTNTINTVNNTNTIPGPGRTSTTTRPMLISRRASILGRRPTFSRSFCGTVDPTTQEYPDDSGYLTTPSLSVESSNLGSSSMNSHTVRRSDKVKLSRAVRGGEGIGGDGDNEGGEGEIEEEDINMVNRLEVYRVVGPDSYYMGIIDFNQKWTIKKKLERFIKVNFRGADPLGLSAIEPEQYRDRFIRKMEDILEVEEYSNRIRTITPHSLQ